VRACETGEKEGCRNLLAKWKATGAGVGECYKTGRGRGKIEPSDDRRDYRGQQESRAKGGECLTGQRRGWPLNRCRSAKVRADDGAPKETKRRQETLLIKTNGALFHIIFFE
jgi:hypothetical protein